MMVASIELNVADYHLNIESERSSRHAKALATTIRKENTVTSPRARQLVVQLIDTHNKGDVYSMLRDSCQLIRRFAESLSLSDTLPKEKAVVVAMSNIAYTAKRLSLQELMDLDSILRMKYGQKFFDWTAKNGGHLVDERIVKKLGQSVPTSLMDSYLHEIIKPHMAPTPLTRRGTQSNEPQKVSKPKPLLTESKPSQPITTKKGTNALSSSKNICISKLAPTLPIRLIRPNPRLEIAFDVRTRNPLYAIERLDGTPRSTGPLVRPAFFEEKRLPPEYQSRLCNFICSGYDRGHLAPAADFGPESVKDTFNMCNISPQNQNMNRSIWVKLEHWCRQAAKNELLRARQEKSVMSDVYVVTGPVWLPTKSIHGGVQKLEFEAIGTGDTLIHVPTHFFKVVAVVVDHNRRIEKFACFLVPNLKPKRDASLEDFVIEWDRLETITGLQFFPNLVDEDWKKEATEQKCTLLKIGSIKEAMRKREGEHVSPRSSSVSDVEGRFRRLHLKS